MICILSVIVLACWDRQLLAKLAHVIVMHADDAGLGQKILVLGAEGPVVFILVAMFLILAASIIFAALVRGLLLRLLHLNKLQECRDLCRW